MSPAPPCTSTMGSIAKFTYQKIENEFAHCNFGTFTIQNRRSTFTLIAKRLIYSNFIVSNSTNQFCVCLYERPPPAPLLLYCVVRSILTAQTQKRMPIDIERHSDLRSKVKDLTSTSKSYAIILLFNFVRSFVLYLNTRMVIKFVSVASRRSQQIRHWKYIKR